ncbi:hypothetical protein C1645_840905, partial [Glomus cerebriforme]
EQNKRVRRGNFCQIQGRVVELISVQDEKYLNALDISGRRLYDVVVENDEVATQPIKEENLQECENFIPLNMIQTYKISSERDTNTFLRITTDTSILELKRIQNIAPGKVNQNVNQI